jgi:hypothetical protein
MSIDPTPDPWAECCAAWLAAHDNPHTQRAYAGILAAFIAWLPAGAAGLPVVTRAAADAWYRHLSESGLAPTTIEHRRHVLHSLYRYASESYITADGSPLWQLSNPFERRSAARKRPPPPPDQHPVDPPAAAIDELLAQVRSAGAKAERWAG